MAEPIDGLKPPSPSPGQSARVGVPAQQARAGRSGFDGGSYFEKGAAYTPHRDRHMLDPPATTGPMPSARLAIEKTLEALGLQPDANIIIPFARP
ncbi:MAG TPA: hypothetical protein VND93_25345 [Myxococcales bacterium]|nr:hypothetical protein [Myxococcales bacterium]